MPRIGCARLSGQAPKLQEPAKPGSQQRMVRALCCDFPDHQFEEVGRHRVLCRGSFPSSPEGTIEYIDYQCAVCGRDYSEEALYSWRTIIGSVRCGTANSLLNRNFRE